MKMLATLLGAVTAIALLSGCTYGRYDRYAYGYGPYVTYNQSYWNAHGCWLDSENTPHCLR